MKRYRYIIAECKPSDTIGWFRLVSSAYIATVAREPGQVYIRVWIPDDMKLKKIPGKDYSTTDDERTIEELGWDLIITTWTNRRKVIPKDSDLKKLTDEQRKLYFSSAFGGRETLVKRTKYEKDYQMV